MTKIKQVPRVANDAQPDWAIEVIAGGIADKGLQGSREASSFEIDPGPLEQAWLELKVAPTQPALLLGRIAEFLEYPRATLGTPAWAALDVRGKTVDDAYDKFARSARELNAQLDALAPHEYVLADAMKARIPADLLPEIRRDLHVLDHVLDRIVALPLRPESQFRRTKGPLARHIVAIVAWYVLVDEGGKFRCTFTEDDGFPKSREARLCAGTLHGLGVRCDQESLNTYMREVRGILRNKDTCPDWYTMLMFWPPSARSQDSIGKGIDCAICEPRRRAWAEPLAMLDDEADHMKRPFLEL